MTTADLDPATEVTLAQQQSDVNALLSGDIDAAQAMTCNEYARVLEATNPATGALCTADDVNTIDWNDEGTAMLQDAIWANTGMLADAADQDRAVMFVKASLKGWIHARDNPEKARDTVVASGSKLGNSHPLWQTNETTTLIRQSTDGIGMIDETAWDQTVGVALTTRNDQGATVITTEPDRRGHQRVRDQGARRDHGGGVDVTGSFFTPIDVTLEAGGN